MKIINSKTTFVIQLLFLSSLIVNTISISSNIPSPVLAQIDKPVLDNNPSFGNSSTTQANFTSGQVLASWNDTLKEKIINFVKNVTEAGSPNYVPPEERIAVFDNDGTLWAEKPTYFQGFFILDRLQELAKTNPEIQQEAQKNPEIKKLLENNFTDLNLSEKDIMYLAMTTEANITQPAFNILVQKWAETAQHPQTHRKFVDMVYQPMLELINYLKAKDFKVFISSGGGIDFMRQALSKVYGIPPEQIIGSSLKYEFINGTNSQVSTIFREGQLDSDNNNAVKPGNIQLHIGRIPVIAG
jgi:phosphoglycolate phosphatase-like HAD superfamily hydrolase